MRWQRLWIPRYGNNVKLVIRCRGAAADPWLPRTFDPDRVRALADAV